MQKHSPEGYDPEINRSLRSVREAIVKIDKAAIKSGHPTIRTGVNPIRVFIAGDEFSCPSKITVIEFMPEWFSIFPPRGMVWTYSPIRNPEWGYQVRSLEMIGDAYYQERQHDALLIPAGRLSVPVPRNGVDVTSTPGSLTHFAISLQEILEGNFRGDTNQPLPRPTVSDRMRLLLNRFTPWYRGLL